MVLEGEQGAGKRGEVVKSQMAGAHRGRLGPDPPTAPTSRR